MQAIAPVRTAFLDRAGAAFLAGFRRRGGGGGAITSAVATESRSSLPVRTEVQGNSPYSTWQLLMKSWAMDGDQVTEHSAQTIPASGRAIELLASQVASLPVGVFENMPDGSKRRAFDHPLDDALRFRPHPLVSSYDFRCALIRSLLVKGEQCAIMDITRRGEYRLQMPESRPEIIEKRGRFYYVFEGQAFDSEKVLHFKINTLNGVRGQGATALYPRTFERILAEIQLGRAYYVNAGQVSGLLVPEHELSAKQAEQAMNVWAKQNVGKEKHGKIGMLPAGFKFIALGSSMKDNLLLDARKATLQDVANMTGVDALLLNSLDGTTFNNMEEAGRKFVQFTLRPLLKLIEDEINSKAFTREERRSYFVRFNVDGLLRGDTKSRGAFYQIMRNISAMSPNEVRALEGMDPYEGGDRYDLPLASNVKPENQQTDGEGAEE